MIAPLLVRAQSEAERPSRFAHANLLLPAPPTTLRSVALSHGWARLPLFCVAPNHDEIVVGVSEPGRPYYLRLRQTLRGIGVSVFFRPGRGPTRNAARQTSLEILGLDVDLADFWRRCAGVARLRWAVHEGAGRFLRCPSLFEDLVVLLCTTNCSWNRAVAQVAVLCQQNPNALPVPTLPPPSTFLELGTDGLRKLGLGFRARFVIAAAEAGVRGVLPSRSHLRDMDPTTARATLLALPGVGPYVAETLLRIAGVPDFYGLDSWNTTKVADAARGSSGLDRRYRSFGRWRGLAFWLDATAHWYERETRCWP